MPRAHACPIPFRCTLQPPPKVASHIYSSAYLAQNTEAILYAWQPFSSRTQWRGPCLSATHPPTTPAEADPLGPATVRRPATRVADGAVPFYGYGPRRQRCATPPPRPPAPRTRTCTVRRMRLLPACRRSNYAGAYFVAVRSLRAVLRLREGCGPKNLSRKGEDPRTSAQRQGRERTHEPQQEGRGPKNLSTEAGKGEDPRTSAGRERT